MTREQVSTDDAPRPLGAYSQGIVANGFLYTAGVGPMSRATGSVVGATIEEQTAQVMANLQAILAARGLGFGDVVKTTVHLADLDRDFRGFDATYRRFLVEPFPARTTVGSALPGILVEIDMIAAIAS